MTNPASELYEQDFFEWTERNAELLREGRIGEADIAHIAEEIEDMGRRDRREVFSRMRVLIAHLLKWGYQPDQRVHSQASWLSTIREQRNQLDAVLLDSPSLRRYARENLALVYERAPFDASGESGLGEDSFPPECPWDVDQILDRAFLPG